MCEYCESKENKFEPINKTLDYNAVMRERK